MREFSAKWARASAQCEACLKTARVHLQIFPLMTHMELTNSSIHQIKKSFLYFFKKVLAVIFKLPARRDYFVIITMNILAIIITKPIENCYCYCLYYLTLG